MINGIGKLESTHAAFFFCVNSFSLYMLILCKQSKFLKLKLEVFGLSCFKIVMGDFLSCELECPCYRTCSIIRLGVYVCKNRNVQDKWHSQLFLFPFLSLICKIGFRWLYFSYVGFSSCTFFFDTSLEKFRLSCYKSENMNFWCIPKTADIIWYHNSWSKTTIFNVIFVSLHLILCSSYHCLL